MFTLPASILGTKHDVKVYDVGLNTFASALFGSPGHCQTLPHVTMMQLNSMRCLFVWAKTLLPADLDHLVEICLPNAQYSALEASWNYYSRVNVPPPTSQTPASAFKVGDLVKWNPHPNRTTPAALVVGATYRILACVYVGPPAVWSLGYYNGNTHLDVADEDELTHASANAPAVMPVASQTPKVAQQLPLFGAIPFGRHLMHLPLPLGTTTGITGTGIVVPYVKKCECGADKCKHPIHSDWCQLYKPSI